jgi:hypothetical protein
MDTDSDPILPCSPHGTVGKEEHTMAKERMPVKFEKPPVHVTASGSLCIKADDIFHSKVGQDVILRMLTIEPLPPKGKIQPETPKKAGA